MRLDIIPGALFPDYEGGLNAPIRSLAIEYAKEGIRFNAVAPGDVDTRLQKDRPRDFYWLAVPFTV